MSPKQIILLMRILGVGKENYAPPNHARAWTTTEFLDACTRKEIMRRTKNDPPERTTIDSWFSANGPIPDDRRAAWHYFFHVFFSYERREFGTQDWKTAYFDALRRARISQVWDRSLVQEQGLPITPPSGSRPVCELLPLLRGAS